MGRVAKKRVRPQTITAEVEERLIERLIEGNTVEEACAALEIRYNTVVNSPDAAFLKRLARAKEFGAHACVDQATDMLRKATAKNADIVRKSAQHLREKAAKLLPDVYGDGPTHIVP